MKWNWKKIGIFLGITCLTLYIYSVVIYSSSERMAEDLIRGTIKQQQK
jgi:hypothetical protein